MERSVPASSMASDAVVNVLVHRHVHGEGFRHRHCDGFLHGDVIGLVDGYWDLLLHVDGIRALSLDGDGASDGNLDALRHALVHGHGVRHGHGHGLRHCHGDGLRHGHADHLHLRRRRSVVEHARVLVDGLVVSAVEVVVAVQQASIGAMRHQS